MQTHMHTGSHSLKFAKEVKDGLFYLLGVSDRLETYKTMVKWIMYKTGL